MGVEIQIRTDRFEQLLKRTMQYRLRQLCFDPIGSYFVDHIDVADVPMRLEVKDQAVHVHVPLRIFIVERSDVLTNPNGIPSGALTPARTGWLELAISTASTKVELKSEGLTFDPPSTPFDSVAQTMVVSAMTPITVADLGSALGTFGIASSTPGSSDVGQGVVAIRFAGLGPLMNHLGNGQEWGFFVDGQSLADQAEKAARPALEKNLTSVRMTSQWQPSGTLPIVHVTYAGLYGLPDPFPAADVSGVFDSSFSLISTYKRVLQTAVGWTIEVDLGALVPAAFDAIARQIAAAEINKPDPKKTITGPRSFTQQTWLPENSFGAARLNYAEAVASPAGMTIGGAIQLASDPGMDIVSAAITPFGQPYRLTFCSTLAKSGSGDPPRDVLPTEVSSHASAWLDHCGKLCEIEILSPGPWLKPYVFATHDEADEAQEFIIDVPSLTAIAITQPVQVLMRTARGVRLLEWAAPPPVQIQNGKVVNAVVNHIDDCFKLSPDFGDITRIDWGSIPDPLDDPDPEITYTWPDYLRREPVVDIQVVRLSGLEPGEQVRFQSNTHRISVTADAQGQAVIPVFLGNSDGELRGSLTVLTGGTRYGSVEVQSVVLRPQAVLAVGGAVQDWVRSNTHLRGAERHLEIDTPVLVETMAVQSNRAVRAVHTIPGFSDVPIVVAELEDGGRVLVDTRVSDHLQIVGTFEGPIGAIDQVGTWATTALGDRLMLFRSE